ncbi:MAG: phospholipase D family protein [Thaumarchaeota archaeon]|nr:phospholipase D family protein [Candidatus Calditenuaceae archaeon]
MPRISAVSAISFILLGIVIGVVIAGSGRETVTITETRMRVTTVTTSVRVESDITVQEVCFSRTMNCASIIVNLIDGARSTVLVAVYSFTRDDIASALIRAQRRGVEVRVVMEEDQSAVSGSEYRRLRDGGVNVRLDGNPDLMHHKFIVIDGRIVITGSYNFSGAAEDRNDENIIVIMGEGVASQYRSEFERVWRAATP